MKTFILAWVLLLLNTGRSPEAEPYKLIAHRGGVVETLYAENSADAVQEAIDRGYWMIEIDIRETKDGKAVIQHDPNFQRFYNHNQQVVDMTLDDIKQLRSEPGNQAPLTLEEMAQLCQGKLQLMLDTKSPHSKTFCQKIGSTLEKYRLLESAYVIGTEESREYFMGKAKVGANREHIRQAQQQGEKIAERYFLFEHGNELDAEIVVWAQENNLEVVPSVNKFHYQDYTTMMKDAQDDIVWLQEAGVSQFQIDSEFDQWF